MTDEPTLGEAHRRIDRVETRLDLRVVTLDAYRAERDADKEQIRAVTNELAAMAERLRWAWRAAVTGVILPFVLLIGAAFFQGRAL